MHRLDFVERVRSSVFKPLGLTGTLTQAQYVGTLDITVEEFEYTLHEKDFIRNAPAWYKESPEDEWSIGSWVYLPDGYFGTWQVHITLFPGGDIYVHREYNWRRHPIRHLRGTDGTAPAEQWRVTLAQWGVPFEVKHG